MHSQEKFENEFGMLLFSPFCGHYSRRILRVIKLVVKIFELLI
jgi:hypothetical protein